MTGAPQNLGVDTFPDPVGHFGAHWQAVRRCRRCGVAGGERVPPAPLGWYFKCFLVMKEKFVLKRIMFTKIYVARLKCKMKQMRLKTYKTYTVGRTGMGVYYKK